ncbi:MAG: cyclodeaminase/cyclohydrolase family protein [Candidatus Omnitrophica bacterium]|nr:cyclodeaminase/cyclohydrolase family protein [Candidatus Omnitrophota bacterium]
MYASKSLTDYLHDLAAKLPAPGGGSAAALSAALGASLISMVINFTIGKPKYARYERELKAALKKSEAARREFLHLADKDAVAYKTKDMKASLDVPVRVCRLCADTAALCPVLVKKGNVNLASDAGAAAVLLESAFFSALFSVDINLKYRCDGESAVRLRKELDGKGRRVKNLRLKTEAGVGKIIRG